jgi:hypothetical protein
MKQLKCTRGFAECRRPNSGKLNYGERHPIVMLFSLLARRRELLVRHGLPQDLLWVVIDSAWAKKGG